MKDLSPVVERERERERIWMSSLFEVQQSCPVLDLAGVGCGVLSSGGELGCIRPG